jgi:hypothetical protein
MSGSQPMNAAQLQQQNLAIRSLVLQNSQDMTQAIYSGSVVPAQQAILNIVPKNVGILKGFLVEVTATFANAGTGAAALMPFGAANVISNFTFTDLDNYQRINTSGWHLNLINSAKENFPFASAMLSGSNDNPWGMGNNTNILAATASIAASGTGTIKTWYYVPIAYGKKDLRGMVYMGVVNATANLQLTFNQQPGVTTGDNTLAIYSGANTAVTMTGATVTVYQNYLDQVPKYQSGTYAGTAILPPLDAMTQYRLNSTSLTGISAGQDFPVPFSNFQEFLSLATIYDQAGTRNAYSDVNYFALAAANTLQFFKYDPYVQALKQRIRMKADFPPSVSLFDFRDDPISTNQSGNMQLFMNAISAAAGSNLLCGFESFALVNTVLGAQSLPAN